MTATIEGLRPCPDIALDLHTVDGDRFHCGWCDRWCHWAQTALGYVELAGGYGLDLNAHDEVIVVVEVDVLVGEAAGERRLMPHECLEIPADVQEWMLDKARALGVIQ